MKAGMKTALRTAAWSTSALLMLGAAAGTATAAAHHHKHAKKKAPTESTDAQARPKMLHDLATVQTSDGSFEQYASQFGEVTAVSDSSISVVSADEYSATYAIDDDTVVLKDGKKATAGDVAEGDRVFVRAEDEDGTFTAEVIGDGKPPTGGHGGPGGHRPPGGPGAPGAGGPGAPGGAPGEDDQDG